MDDFRADLDKRQIVLGDIAEFHLGSMRVVPAERAVEIDGERHDLQPRVMQVLVALAQAKPGVISRDRLVERCWEGRIVGDDAVNRCILVLRQIVQGYDPPPFQIETVPRVGHRLIESGSFEQSKLGRPAFSNPPRPLRMAIVGLIVAALVAVGYFVWQNWQQPNEPASIAVLPFRNLSGGDPYFADGLGEDITVRLSREPDFRVVGRTSSAQFGKAADLRQIGDSLGADYILEGSVRMAQGRVRVIASLVKSSDGIRLWSETFDKDDQDVFAIQQEIGNSVALALRRKLVRNSTMPTPASANGEAYRLYLSARGMLRTRNPQMAEPALGLLNQAIDIDPDFAPAWSSLADAIRLESALKGHENVIAALPKAREAARRSIRLSPNLAESHGVLGMLLGFTSEEAQTKLRRAAQLDPTSAETQLWLATAEHVTGNFEGELASYRRAHSLDPLWFRPVRDLALATAELGEHDQAEELALSALLDSNPQKNALLARLAGLRGDYSAEIGKRQRGVLNDSIWNTARDVGLATALFALGMNDSPRPPPPAVEFRPPLGRISMNAAPAPDVWQRQNRNDIAAFVYRHENIVAAKMMVNAGRYSELASTYRSAHGLLGLPSNSIVKAHHLHSLPLIVITLRNTGRKAEAQQLLDQADHVIAVIRRGGRVPYTFDVDEAAIRAAQGRTETALNLLSQALKRGWTHTGVDDLRRLDEEPAFASLKNERKFAAIVDALNGLYAKERQETLKLPSMAAKRLNN